MAAVLLHQLPVLIRPAMFEKSPGLGCRVAFAAVDVREHDGLLAAGDLRDRLAPGIYAAAPAVERKVVLAPDAVHPEDEDVVGKGVRCYGALPEVAGIERGGRGGEDDLRALAREGAGGPGEQIIPADLDADLSLRCHEYGKSGIS